MFLSRFSSSPSLSLLPPPLSPLSLLSRLSSHQLSLSPLNFPAISPHLLPDLSPLFLPPHAPPIHPPLSPLFIAPLSSLSPRLSNGEEHSASAKLAGTGNREGSGKRGRAAQRALGSESLWKVATWRHGKVGESLRFARAARSGKQREAGPALQPTIAKGGGKWVMGSGRKLGGAAGAGNCSQDAWVHSR
ncbi:hypothetical protein CLOP_g24875 [Closterium sp. NIES-67]|nr:hypothetical protein CLOP_g24875 [Closterium sp. NIES-67]